MGYMKCAICKRVLLGIPKAEKLRFLPKSMKRVSRKYGGYLCSKCATKKIKEEARKIIKKLKGIK